MRMPDNRKLVMSNTYERIYKIVCRIPEGRVATYGQIARLLGAPGWSRQVGYALAALRDDRVPWHRVVNARGGISPRAKDAYEHLQRSLLEAEGVVFDSRGFIPLARYQWQWDKRD